MPDSSDTRHTFEVLSGIARKKSFFFSDIWGRSYEEFGDGWMQELVDNVTRLFGDGTDGRWESAIQGYAEFALDAMRNQKFFEKNGTYRFSKLSEIQERFYESEDHMMRNYLPGMYLSHYLWPHHFKLLSFFRSEVLNWIPEPEVFFEVGTGTGMYSRETMRRFPGLNGRGFDISTYSIAFTRNLLAAYGLLDRYRFERANIFEADLPWGTADFLVSQEVLEHLEAPDRFCSILHDLTRPGGHGYITAAINAGHSDHIYLFRSPEEVRRLLSDAGWTVLKEKAEYGYEAKSQEVAPCVAAFLCRRGDDGGSRRPLS